MTDEESNTLRCAAHEIIIKLMEANRIGALELLFMHCDKALEKVTKDSPNPHQRHPELRD